MGTAALADDPSNSPRFYIVGCRLSGVIVWPVFALYATHQPVLIWLGMVVGLCVPGVMMSATLQTLLSEMFDVEARTTGVNLGYQISGTLGGGLAPMICVALVARAGGIWPVGVYLIVVGVISAVATAFAALRPDTEDDARLHELDVVG